jgi:hypothetical protein
MLNGDAYMPVLSELSGQVLFDESAFQTLSKPYL